ncbi:hypothetical protein KY290_020317 [Solanum tuberosum]|uniref:Disease resistance N-terminal domain-containing protein n=1 Tax=Solanum tuberosum TaxID=4113 RepID=A0ABQ7UYB8_SOLTU|nr:hypothetical protein KY290_020317 [Solanum tuberosum]
MADAVVNFLVENLLQLLTENVKLIGGAKGELENLLKIAQQLKAFLDDAAKYGYTNSEQWKVLVIEIHKTVHRAEDAIDKFLVQAKLHQEKNTMGRIFDWPRNLIKVKNLAAEIKEIHDQVKELRKNNQALQATPVIELPKKGEVTQGVVVGESWARQWGGVRLGTESEWDHWTGTNRYWTKMGRFDWVVDWYRDELDRNYRDGGSVPFHPTISG